MSDFGDSEPEDSWDADDPIPLKLENILRRIALLRNSIGPMATAREQLRFEHIDVDLAGIIAELRGD